VRNPSRAQGQLNRRAQVSRFWPYLQTFGEQNKELARRWLTRKCVDSLESTTKKSWVTASDCWKSGVFRRPRPKQGDEIAIAAMEAVDRDLR